MENTKISVHDLSVRVQGLMRDGVLSLCIEQIKDDFAKRIVQTEPNAGALREEYYMRVKALDDLEMKLQDYVNEISQETY